eukprot:UN05459
MKAEALDAFAAQDHAEAHFADPLIDHIELEEAALAQLNADMNGGQAPQRQYQGKHLGIPNTFDIQNYEPPRRTGHSPPGTSEAYENSSMTASSTEADMDQDTSMITYRNNNR